MAKLEVLSSSVHDFWRALDLREYDKMIRLIAEDCKWQRESLIIGRPAIRAAMDARPTNFVTRHQITNLRITQKQGALATQYLLTTFGVMDLGNSSAPADCGGPALIADTEMCFEANATSPLITSISHQIVFRKAHA